MKSALVAVVVLIGQGAAPPFDRSAAVAALGAVDTAGCGASGQSHVTVTFAPDGTVPEAVIDAGSLVGTPQGACVAGRFRTVRVPPFSGPKVRIGRSLNL